MNLPRRAMMTMTTVAFFALFVGPQTVWAATWIGDDANWVSDHWGLDGPDGSPGDTNYDSEGTAITNGGQVNINDGDSITTSGTHFVSNGIINQTGGTFTTAGRIVMRTRYDLSGGTLDGVGGFRIEHGGSYNVSENGRMGTRLNSSINSAVFFTGAGTFNITGGTVDVNSIDTNPTSPNRAGDGDALIKVTGSTSSLSTGSMSLDGDEASKATSTLEFVFDAEGISSWKIFGGSPLTLGEGDGRAKLKVDVSALASDGATAFELIDYRKSIVGDGDFGNVTITDSKFGELKAGTAGSLQPGEYALDYAGGDGTDILLSYNTTGQAAAEPE